MIEIIITLILVGVVLYLVGLIPMDATMLKIIRVVVIVLVVLWILNVMGVYHFRFPR